MGYQLKEAACIMHARDPDAKIFALQLPFKTVAAPKAVPPPPAPPGAVRPPPPPMLGNYGLGMAPPPPPPVSPSPTSSNLLHLSYPFPRGLPSRICPSPRTASRMSSNLPSRYCTDPLSLLFAQSLVTHNRVLVLSSNKPPLCGMSNQAAVCLQRLVHSRTGECETVQASS